MLHAVALLRGMNLGKRRITNAELQEHFRDMGFDPVATFRASGNVLFGGPTPADLEAAIAQGLEQRLNYPVPTFVRERQELADTLAAVPFSEQERSSHGKLQIVFLTASPSAAQRQQVLDLATDEDLLGLHGRALYWLPRAGISTSALDFKAVERILGGTTTRTEGTCQSLLKKLG